MSCNVSINGILRHCRECAEYRDKAPRAIKAAYHFGTWLKVFRFKELITAKNDFRAHSKKVCAVFGFERATEQRLLERFRDSVKFENALALRLCT